jgi:tRNA uridine 5-carboxymethylaminomethyl modification enzyme
MRPNFQIIVIGAGHAGCEAALISARMGIKTALITMNRLAVARMSCNPSIGGIAKSHIVFEIDQLGGEMARNADYTGIQFRMLNTKKGPAVQALRAQCDKPAYSTRMLSVLTGTENLTILESNVREILVKSGKVAGVILDDFSQITSHAIVLTAGTYLNGMIHIGKNSVPGGRIGEPSANFLSDSLINLGFKLGRLKTGTPPRLHKRSIDYGKLMIQPGDIPPNFFSDEVRALFHVEQVRASDKKFHVEQPTPLMPWFPGSDQTPCYLTHTTPLTHQIIASNLNSSALYGGIISGTGVRYCPSIEDKIVKFADKESHHIFIEPEGRSVDEIYPNGTSCSLPESVQIEMIHSIPGLERAEFINWAYAIEYDFSDPTQLLHSLETKRVENLYFAGQINGTSGYEEAAGQGLIAGINAALKIKGDQQIVISRSEGYIGVLIDDLVTKGTEEPYRMFSSRAEYRLVLRQDNARIRMRPFAERIGVLPSDYHRETRRHETLIAAEMNRLDKTFHGQTSQLQLLRRPEVRYRDLPDPAPGLPTEVIPQIEVEAKYAGYIAREGEQIARLKKMESHRLPPDFDYASIAALRLEAREKLNRLRPAHLGQAARIPGVSPADIAVLSVFLKKEVQI